MKPIQILTQESRDKIRKAIVLLEVINEKLPMDVTEDRIKELTEILIDTE